MSRPAPDNERFLSRWSRLKRAQVAAADGGAPNAVPATPAPSTLAPSAPQAAGAAPAAGARPAAPAAVANEAHALPAIESLTMESDYAPFFQAKVPEGLRRAAVKKLFADPHFNIMDGLDTYIDDYSRPDPLPPGMLGQLVQARDIIDHPSNRKPEEGEPVPGVTGNAAGSAIDSAVDSPAVDSATIAADGAAGGDGLVAVAAENAQEKGPGSNFEAERDSGLNAVISPNVQAGNLFET